MATAQEHAHLNIRPAREEDAPALREIFNDAVQDGLATFDCALRSIEDEKRLIIAAEQDARRPLFVAEVRNLVCGLVSLEPHEEKQVMDHMRSCESCSAELEDWKLLAGGLRRLPTPQPRPT